MSSRFGWALVVAVIMVASGPVPLMAGDDGPNTGKVSLSGGVDFVTAYYFRGIAQETHGFIAQPYVDIGLNILEPDEGWLNSLDLGVGTWNSLHSEHGTGIVVRIGLHRLRQRDNIGELDGGLRLRRLHQPQRRLQHGGGGRCDAGLQRRSHLGGFGS